MGGGGRARASWAPLGYVKITAYRAMYTVHAYFLQKLSFKLFAHNNSKKQLTSASTLSLSTIFYFKQRKNTIIFS